MATSNKLPEGSTWNSFKLENVTQDQEITVTFSPDVNADGIPDKYQTVTVTSAVDGSGSVDPSKNEVALGGEATFTVTPGAGMALYQVKNGDDVLYTNTSDNPFSGTYTVENVVENMTITFVFSKDTDGDGIPDLSETWFKITMTGDDHVNVTSGEQSDEVSVKIGNSAVVDLTPVAGYAIDTVTIDGEPYVNNGQTDPINGTDWLSYTFSNVQGDHTISVTSASTTDDTGVADKYKLTVTPVVVDNVGGQISLDPQLVVYGHDVVATITPEEGYAVDTIQTSSDTYVNNPNYGKAYVTEAADIQSALEDPEVNQIVVNSPIAVASETQISKPMTINGNGNKITQTATGKTFTMTQDSTLDEVVVESTADNTEWHSSYGVQFYTGEHTVKDSKFSGGNAAIIVNGATVNLEGTVDVSGNTFGGIEVCKGSNPDLTAGVLNIGTASIVNTTEAYGQPTIWIDGNTDDVGIVNGAESMTMVEVAHGDTTQKQYYLNAENSHPIIAGSTGYDTLADAITGAAGETIHIKADLNETVSVAAGSTVVIDGEGHKLHGTINLQSGGSAATTGSVKVSDLVFDGQGDTSWGLYLQNQTETAGQSSFDVELTGCEFKNMTKKGLYVTETSSLKVIDCTFDTCATDTMNDPNTYGDYVVDCNLVGVKNATVEVSGCTFSNNGAQKAAIKVTQRGGESDEGAGDMPQGITATVDLFTVTGCTFNDTVEGCADVAIGSDNKSASTNPDAENTTGDFGQTTISGNLTAVDIITQYDGETYSLSVGGSFTRTGSGEPVVA